MKLKPENINIRAFLHHSAGSVLLSVVFRRADRDLVPCAGKNQESRPALPGNRRATCRHRLVCRYPAVAGAGVLWRPGPAPGWLPPTPCGPEPWTRPLPRVRHSTLPVQPPD